MGKVGVLSFNRELALAPMALKKLYLMFDKIVIDDNCLMSLDMSLSYTGKQLLQGEKLYEYQKRLPTGSDFQYNRGNIEYLLNDGFLMPWEVDAELTSKEMIAMDKDDLYKKDRNNNYVRIVSSDMKNLDFNTRALAIGLKKNYQMDTYPLLMEYPKPGNASLKAEVLNFILEEIPEPDESVSWEQLQDFKADENAMLKYYALINWVNNVSTKERPLYEIEEEYKYLFCQYQEQFRVHKMKTKQGFIELLVSTILDITASQLTIGTTAVGLFSIWKKQVDLLEAETKFPGKEVAYVHMTKEKFS